MSTTGTFPRRPPRPEGQTEKETGPDPVKAGPLDAIEYVVAFRQPGSDVDEPVAGHVRTILAICDFADVSRSSLDPSLVQLASLVRKNETVMAGMAAMARPPIACRFCLAPNAIVVRDYLCVCECCGYENDNTMVQDDVRHLPPGKATCGTPADSRALDDAATQHVFRSSLRTVEQRVHTIASHGMFLNLAQEIRAAQLAHMYFVDQGLRTRRRSDEIAAACCVFVLLETWASILVPTKVIRNDAWTTQWVLPAQTAQTRTTTTKQTKNR